MSPHWPLTLYHDRDCPLCARETDWLQKHASPSKLVLVDISAADFDPAALNISLPTLQNCLHARFADGTWVLGLEATYWSWRAAGKSMWIAPLRWRWMRAVLQPLYRFFCLIRPNLAWLPHPDGTRQCSLNGDCTDKEAK